MQTLVVLYFVMLRQPYLPRYLYSSGMRWYIHTYNNSSDVGFAVSVTEVSIAAYFGKIPWQYMCFKTPYKFRCRQLHLLLHSPAGVIFVIKAYCLGVVIYRLNPVVGDGYLMGVPAQVSDHQQPD